MDPLKLQLKALKITLNQNDYHGGPEDEICSLINAANSGSDLVIIFIMAFDEICKQGIDPMSTYATVKLRKTRKTDTGTIRPEEIEKLKITVTHDNIQKEESKQMFKILLFTMEAFQKIAMQELCPDELSQEQIQALKHPLTTLLANHYAQFWHYFRATN